MTEQIQKLMKNLNITEEEALQLVADDKAIDRGERMSFDLSKEDEKIAKKWANVGEKTVKTAKKSPNRKKNDTKATIISQISQFLSENTEISAENVEIINAERQISFKIGEKSFSITLTQHRK